VNPDLPGQSGQYVLVDGDPKGVLLRQLKHVGGEAVLHPLNRRYEDLPLSPRHRIWGRVVRLRKNL
jgi:SOS-response transcriptional repressor LexA